jgi:hypothetical protein
VPSVIIEAIKEGDYERALSIIYAGHDEHGKEIDVNATDSEGHSALTYACAANRPELVRALVEAGAEVQVQGLPLERLSQRTKAALRVGFCATFASETVHWWMAPRLARLMHCPAPIGELVLAYTGRMEVRPQTSTAADLESPTLTFLLV